VGNNSEGIYGGYTYITASGTIAHSRNVGSVWGSIAVTGLNWVFNPETKAYFITADSVTGSGTFSPKISMDGTYSTAGSSSSGAFGPLKYSADNALAVSQASVATTWSADGTIGFGASQVSIDSKGVLTGNTSSDSLGMCKLSGSVLLSQPGSAKNLYAFTLNAVNSATGSQKACALDTLSPYVGLGAITFRSAGIWVSNGYFRNLSFLVKSGNGATWNMSFQAIRPIVDPKGF